MKNTKKLTKPKLSNKYPSKLVWSNILYETYLGENSLSFKHSVAVAYHTRKISLVKTQEEKDFHRVKMLQLLNLLEKNPLRDRQISREKYKAELALKTVEPWIYVRKRIDL